MTVSAALILAAILLSVAGQKWLSAFARWAHPTLGLTAWISSIAAVFALLGSAVTVLMWPDHAPAERIVELAIECLSAVQHSASLWVGESLALASAIVATATIVHLARSARAQLRDRAHVRDRHRDAISIVARVGDEPDHVMWLDHPLPLAYSVGGRPGFIVATAGLRTHLDDQQQSAVLAHERAHLRGRHHTIVVVVDILRTAFPFVPLFAAAPAALRVLVELAADRSAAAVTSADTVKSALTTVSRADSARPTWALGLMSATTRDRMVALDAMQSPATSRAHAAVALLPVVVITAVATLSLSAASSLICSLAQI